MLKGDFRKAAHSKQGVLISDLNGTNMENIIHLNRFIFLVDETKLEDMNRAYSSSGCTIVFACFLSKYSVVVVLVIINNEVVNSLTRSKEILLWLAMYICIGL